MQILDFLFSNTMIEIVLAALIIAFSYKVAKEQTSFLRTENEPEDIEGHISGIHESETPTQAIDWYKKGNRYNELRSEAFLEKMAQFHQNTKESMLS